MTPPATLDSGFQRAFGVPPQRLVRAPGRVNLIGEHTDYNQGLVMPAAIDLDAWVAMTPRRDRRLVLRSTHYPEAAEFDLDAPTAANLPRWSRALHGIAVLLDGVAAGRGRGANLLIDSRVPIGAGLSSSAAVEVAVGYALAAEAGTEPDLTALALLCQRANHEFAGIRCGIMDQFIAGHGRAGFALRLDTRDLGCAWLPLPPTVALLVANTMVRHDHGTGEYNRRRAECEEAVARLARVEPGLPSLRPLSPAALARYAALLPAPLLARSRHVVSENARVEAAATALQGGDFDALGRLLDASHASLRDDYEVSCPELDLMAEICRRQPGVWGARMMGGGFGGSVLALIRPECGPALIATVGAEYARRTGLAAQLRICSTAAGVTAHEPDSPPTL